MQWHGLARLIAWNAWAIGGKDGAMWCGASKKRWLAPAVARREEAREPGWRRQGRRSPHPRRKSESAATCSSVADSWRCSLAVRHAIPRESGHPKGRCGESPARMGSGRRSGLPRGESPFPKYRNLRRWNGRACFLDVAILVRLPPFFPFRHRHSVCFTRFHI